MKQNNKTRKERNNLPTNAVNEYTFHRIILDTLPKHTHPVLIRYLYCIYISTYIK